MGAMLIETMKNVCFTQPMILNYRVVNFMDFAWLIAMRMGMIHECLIINVLRAVSQINAL